MRTSDRGFALTLVLLGLMVIELIGIGVLSVATSDLHGAVSSRLSLQAFNLAEGGLHYATAMLGARASAADASDERYTGEARDLQVSGPGGNPIGSVRLAVSCVYPAGAVPPACQDDATAPGVNGRDFREITAVATIPAWPGRARRELEATVRRYRPAAEMWCRLACADATAWTSTWARWSRPMSEATRTSTSVRVARFASFPCAPQHLPPPPPASPVPRGRAFPD